MSENKKSAPGACARDDEQPQCAQTLTPERGQLSRRAVLGSAAVGAVAGAVATVGLPGSSLTGPAQAGGDHDDRDWNRHNGRDKRTLILKGGVVLTMDPDNGNLAKADVLIEGSKIKAIGPNLGRNGEVIDCSGMVVMPGFINTHNHQYETIARSVLADGLLQGTWPQESYGSVVQNIWTAGRITLPGQTTPIWDLGRAPYDPEDCYISELVACWSGIDAGVTTVCDTSQASHTPEHSDGMIQGLKDSGRRAVYVYGAGRGTDPRYEFPGAIGDETKGIGRLKKRWFSSNDQLVTLGAWFSTAALWPVARHYGAQMVIHGGLADAIANPGLVGPDLCFIHATNQPDSTFQLLNSTGAHVSLAVPIEMQMGHGTPPVQQSLDAGILPSLSSDVDTNMAFDMFTIMRATFTMQRLHVNPTQGYPHAGKPHLNCQTVLRMATVAGADAAGLGNKVGMIKVGMEADVILLQARALNTHPMLNAPGTVVTMMDTRNVDTVIIGGKVKKRAGKLVGADLERLFKKVERSQERVLARIHSVPIPVDGLHSAPGYTPSLTRSCCLAEEPYPNAN